LGVDFDVIEGAMRLDVAAAETYLFVNGQHIGQGHWRSDDRLGLSSSFEETLFAFGRAP
jgi:hypothetical protein